MKSGPAGHPLAASRDSQSTVGLTLGAGRSSIPLTGQDEPSRAMSRAGRSHHLPPTHDADKEPSTASALSQPWRNGPGRIAGGRRGGTVPDIAPSPLPRQDQKGRHLATHPDQEE